MAVRKTKSMRSFLVTRTIQTHQENPGRQVKLYGKKTLFFQVFKTDISASGHNNRVRTRGERYRS